MHNFIVDYKDTQGRYFHGSYMVPNASGVDKFGAFLAVRETLRRRRTNICAAIYLPGFYTSNELEQIQDGKKPLPLNAEPAFINKADYPELFRERR